MRFPGCVLVIFLLLCFRVGAGEAERTIILGNRNVPVSTELIRRYMEVRAIPQQNVCLLDLPTTEDISRSDYETKLRDPLLAFLRKNEFIQQEAQGAGWLTTTSHVRYIVSMYGVPTRIADTRNALVVKVRNRLSGHDFESDGAAVDSELSVLLSAPYELKGLYRNTAYNELGNLADKIASSHLVIAARLDGDGPETVRRMIDDAFYAEQYGIQGRACFDARGATQTQYAVGDYWITEASERLKREGYEVSIDHSAGIWTAVVPFESVAWYLGWYAETAAGPFMREDFRFARGALAYHLHSSSAKTLRSPTAYWAGPLLARGAATTMGAVGEPFLNFTPHLNILIDRLCMGYSYGESAYMALPAVSWQITVVGDPLFRPFKYSLDEQIKNLERDQQSEVEWAYVRKINTLVRDGRFNLALKYCRDRLLATDSLVLREKLGDLYAGNELYDIAAVEYERVAQKAKTPATAIRVGSKWIALLRHLRKTEQADAAIEDLQQAWQGNAMLPWLGVVSR